MTMRVPLGLGVTLLAWGTCAPAQAYEIAFREASIPMSDGGGQYTENSLRPPLSPLGERIG
jgi:hypothetical protein